MIRNYFKTAWRNLASNRFYSLINISGLACGLATALLLLLWVQHERSYDRFHRDYENIFRITAHIDADGDKVVYNMVPGPISVFARSVPRVTGIVRINDDDDQVLATADRSRVLDGFHTAYVDSAFFDVFDFRLLSGDRSRPLPDHNSVVLTQTTARKLFGNTEPLGAAIRFGNDNFTVTGILEDFPPNSTLRYDALFPMGYYGQSFTAQGGNGEWKTIDEDMANFAFKTFVRLQGDAEPAAAGKEFSRLYKAARNIDTKVDFRLQALKDMHLVSLDGNDAPARMVQIFFIVAILILAIASINYINLTTARALIRIREVSIRKIVGADRLQLFFQFMSETGVLFCLALLAALVLIAALLPAYRLLTGTDLQLSSDLPQILPLIGYTAAGTILAVSIYPALLLSGFRPLESLKRKNISGSGSALFRKALVVMQFTISTGLIVATLVIGRQMEFVRQMDLGYDKDHVFRVPLPSGVIGHIEAVKSELKGKEGVVSISMSDIYDIGDHQWGTGDIEWPGKPAGNQMIIGQAVIDRDFIETMKMELIEGNTFSGTPADSNRYMINEAAALKMGLKPPYVGTPITFHDRKGTITGVVRDFNFKPLKEKITPLLFSRWWSGNILYVRTTAGKTRQAIAAVEKQYKKYAGDIPFSYSFIDEQLQAKYISDQRAGLLFNIFAGIAVFISCLGLLGLSIYTARQRVKEIGIRKVLGAEAFSIARMLSKASVLSVIISFFVASPLTWWLMNRWLADYAYRIDIEWWMFAAAGMLSMIVALLTVGVQTVKAALANPVESLRME